MSERCPATETPRSTTISRRTLAKGVAWAAPSITIVSSAPAIAASPCDPVNYTAPLNTATYTRTSATQGQGTTTAVAGAAPVTFTVGAAARGGRVISAVQNLLPSNHMNSNGGSNLGGLAVTGLQLQQSGGSSSGYAVGQSVTITFSRPVTGLSFYVVDIDRSGTANSSGVYQDAIALSGSPVIDQRATNVAGTATSTDPLRRTVVGDLAPSNGGGNARVTYPGTISSFTLEFWSSAGWAAQQIFLTQMTFTAAGCA